MSVSQYRFEPMSIAKAKQIRDATVAAIKAVQAGGMRSPDPAVRLAVVKMPLNSETFEDRLRARRRLEPVVEDYERTQHRAYKAATERGLPHVAAWLEAQLAAKPERDKHDRIVAERRRAVDRVVEDNRRRRLERERAEAQKAGFR